MGRNDLADLISDRLEIADDFDAVQSLYLERGWTDGLPIVPPTTERVEAMLAATPLGPQDIIGEIPPNWGSATVEKLAVNAVMAGCRPEYLPVVIFGGTTHSATREIKTVDRA